jgi:sulfonate transport system permease protein
MTAERTTGSSSDNLWTVHEPGLAEKRAITFRRRRRLLEGALAVSVPVLALGLWQVAWWLEWIDQTFYPSPLEIITAPTLREADLWADVWRSVTRLFIGYAIGAGSGLVVGTAMGASRLLRAAFEPFLTALYTVPKLALIPVFLTIFGLGDRPRYMLVAVTVFFFVWISTMAAIMSVDHGYRETAQSFDATRYQMFRHVLWPGALPQVFVGLRIGSSVAVLIMVGVELVLSSDGLGHIIEQGRVLFLPEQTYVGIVLASLLGVCFSFAIRRLGRSLTRWAPDDNVIAPN